MASFKGVDRAFSRKYIKGGKFAAFKPTGKQPESVFQTWGGIWNGQDGLKRRYAADCDVYKGDAVEICLSVK